MREELNKFLDIPLSNERRAELSKSLVTTLSFMEQKERELASTSGRIRAEIKELNTKLKNTYDILLAGIENREVACYVEKDFRLGEVRIIRIDNYECIDRRAMTATERQQELGLKEKTDEAPAVETPVQEPPAPPGKFSAVYFPNEKTVTFYDEDGDSLFHMNWETKDLSVGVIGEMPEDAQAIIDAYMKDRTNPGDAEFTLGGPVPEQPAEELPEPPHDETVDRDQLKSFDDDSQHEKQSPTPMTEEEKYGSKGIVQTVPDEELPEDTNEFYVGKPQPQAGQEE